MAPFVHVHKASALTFVSSRPQTLCNATSPRTASSSYMLITPTTCNTSATHGSHSVRHHHHVGTTESAQTSCVTYCLESNQSTDRRASRSAVLCSHSTTSILATTSLGRTMTTHCRRPNFNEDNTMSHQVDTMCVLPAQMKRALFRVRFHSIIHKRLRHSQRSIEITRKSLNCSIECVIKIDRYVYREPMIRCTYHVTSPLETNTPHVKTSTPLSSLSIP